MRMFWRVRPDDVFYHPDDLYDEMETLFTLKINHGGEFTDYPGRQYVNGKVSYIDWVEFDDLSIANLDEMMKDIGYSIDDVFNYFVKEPHVCLDFGLRHLTEDEDIEYVYEKLRKGFKLVDLYVAIGESIDVDLHNAEENSDEDNSDEENSDEDDPDYTIDQEPDNVVFDYDVDMSQFKACVDFDPEEVDDTIKDAIIENTQEELMQDDINCDLEDFSDKDDNCTLLEKVAKKVRKKKKNKGDVSDSYLPFSIGQLILDKQELNQMVKEYAVKSRRQIYIIKNDKLRFRVVCLGTNPTLGSGEGHNRKYRGLGLKQDKRHLKPTCPWAIQISRRTDKDCWCVKTIKSLHHCLQTRDLGLYTMSQIANEIQSMIESNPEMPLTAIQDMLTKKHQLNVSIQKVFRAKRIATTRIIGDYREQYGILRSYFEELMRANPGSTIKIDVEPCFNPSCQFRQFRRCYVCFASIKRGFKMCGREILGLDGCFMKGPFPGQILTAVGVDGNNGIYPVAYALVEAETFKSWEWFLELLRDDLDLGDRTNFTFISDRQKGLVPALSKVFPNAEHRYCLRHIHQNLKIAWPGDVYKNLLWGVACKTSMPYFEKSMEDLKKCHPGFYERISQIQASSWSKAHFSGRAKCDILLNNICEVFNRQLIGARDKPVITCLEFIRVYMTKRIANVKKIQAKAHGPLTPHYQEVFNKIKEEAGQLNVLMVDADRYQVNSYRSQCVVNVKNRTCTCRKWDLTSMPCKHAVAAIFDMARNDVRIGVPEDWVDEVYWLYTWKKVYDNVITPIPGPENWMPSKCPTTLVPPKHHKQAGRPQKKRKKSVGEAEVEAHFDSGGKMTRKGNTIKCSKCGNVGHNSRSCKGQGGDNNQEGRIVTIKCRKCGTFGHNSRTCKASGGENLQESQAATQGAPSSEA